MHIHLSSTNSSDYFTRRERPCPRDLKNAHYGDTLRMAHINMCLAMRSVVRAAGPTVDGTSAEVFYEMESREALNDLLDDDPYVIGKVWASMRLRTLTHFFEPAGLVEPCLDGMRRVIAVEAAVVDRQQVSSVLPRLIEAGSVAVGGMFDDGTMVAWAQAAEPAQALARLAEGGLELHQPTTRSLVWVL